MLLINGKGIEQKLNGAVNFGEKYLIQLIQQKN